VTISNFWISPSRAEHLPTSKIHTLKVWHPRLFQILRPHHYRSWSPKAVDRRPIPAYRRLAMSPEMMGITR